MKSQVREVSGVKVVDLHGKITIGSGDVQMRDTITNLVKDGATKIVVNMSGITTIDSSGVGELVGCYTTVTNKGGKLKLSNLTDKINDILTVTQLITVFDVFETEAQAISSFD